MPLLFTLSRWIVVVLLIGLVMTLTASAEPPNLLEARPAVIKPLTRIGKETVGFAVHCFALASQGDVVALGASDGNIYLWSLADNKVIRTLDAAKNGYIGAIAFSPNGKWLAFHADNDPIRLWDIESGAEIAHSRQEFMFVNEIRFSPSGGVVGLVDDESNAFLWNPVSEKMKKLDQPGSALAFSPDGRLLALGLNTLQLVDVASGSRIREFAQLEGRATSLAFSPDGSQLLAVDSGCRGTTVRLVEIDSGDETFFGDKLRSERAGAAFSADGATVAINDGFSEAIFWDIRSGQKRLTIPSFHRDANFLVFTPNNRRLLSGRGDTYGNDVLIWDVDEIMHAADKQP